MYRFLVGKCAHVVSALHVYVDLRVKYGAETTLLLPGIANIRTAAPWQPRFTLAGYFSITTALP